jgi:hypothetical protein
MLTKKNLRNMITKSEYSKKEIKNDLLKASKYNDIIIDLRVYTCEFDNFESTILLDVRNEEGGLIESYCYGLESIIIEEEVDFWEMKKICEDILKTKKNAWIKWLRENNFTIGNTENFSC